jgi:hypothetical protein
LTIYGEEGGKEQGREKQGQVISGEWRVASVAGLLQSKPKLINTL